MLSSYLTRNIFILQYEEHFMLFLATDLIAVRFVLLTMVLRHTAPCRFVDIY